jgi:hypothetical protein
LRSEEHLLESALLRQPVGLGQVRDLSLDERRADGARTDGRRGDGMPAALERERLDQPDQAVLGRDVGRLVRRGD